MTSKERMLTAFRRQEADHVPVCPDISVMVPDKLTGRPVYDIHLDGREHQGWTSATHAEAYVDAVKYFGMDGWYIYGGLKEIRQPDAPRWTEKIIDVPAGKLVQRLCKTSKGDLSEAELFYADQPPWRQVRPIKNLREDFKKFKCLLGHDSWQWEKEFRDYDRIGDLGIYSAMVPVFQDWWFHHRQGGFEQCFLDFYEESAFMDEVHDYWMEWAIAYLKANLDAKPDEIMLGGSSASLSISSPSLFRRYELPFIQKAARLCRDAGVVSHLHICGRSWELVEIVAENTDVDVMEPMEEPPTGNVDLAEAKRRVGDKLCIKGNINTPEIMLTHTPEQVKEKCKQCIDAAAAGGGYVLSTGDQCGRDTPVENLFAMVEVAKTYGKY